MIHPALFGEGNPESAPYNSPQVATRGETQTGGGRSAVGSDQTAGAELDAAVHATDQDDDTVEPLFLDCPENRLARGSGHFTVVVKSERAIDDPGPGVVRRFGVAMRLQPLGSLFG